MTIRSMLLSSALLVSMAGVAGAQVSDDEEHEGYDFATVDADGDGFVTEAELQAAFDEVGDAGDATAILAAQDTDDDGMISLEEAGADGRIQALEGGEDDV